MVIPGVLYHSPRKPQKSRPRYDEVMALALLVALIAAPAPGPKPTAAELEARMVKLVNVERKARELEPLAVSDELSAIARSYSRRMAATGKVGHELDRPVEDRIRDALPGTCRFGENVSKHTSIEYSLGDLLSSPGHRANLLSRDFKTFGIGIARGDDGFLYITQEFASPCEPRREL